MYAMSKINGEDRFIYTSSITGTTYSGHPTRTTLGNTLRVLSYICFYIYGIYGLEEAVDSFLHKSKLFRIMVAGDDVQVLGEEKAINKLVDMVR